MIRKPARSHTATAVILIACVLAGSAAVAAPRDAALLQSYVGEWKGRGTTTSEGNTETVLCRLDITRAEATKVNYKGRCAIAGGNLAIRGTMAYIVERERFEAVMTTDTAFSGVAVGRRQGDTIDFALRERNQESGKEYDVDAGITLEDGGIAIDFEVTEVASGETIAATIPFEK